jgi:GNAT superfamily N-acetyltransferase
MSTEIKLLDAGDEAFFGNVDADAFDDPIDAASLTRFLNDPRHHIAVAVDAGTIVGFVSAVHYEHPDKPAPELWINEVSVATSHRQRGLGRAMLQKLFAHARTLGCGVAWVLTDRGNHAAMALYASAGGGTPSDHVMIEFRLDDGAGPD